MKKAIVVAALLLCNLLPVSEAYSQTEKEIDNSSEAWLGYFSNIRLGNKISLWNDLHLRRREFLSDWKNIIVRTGVTYHITDHLRATVGYAFAAHAPETGNTFRLEHRPWQQIAWNGKYGRLYLAQWLRIEERFNQKIVADVRTGDYAFNMRFRYMISAQVPLNRKTIEPNTLCAVAGTELFLNAGKHVVYNTFDQNRAFAGLGYQVTKGLNIQLAYMNVFQQLAAGDKYNSAHTLRLFIFHNIDLRKKENS
jgi:hypothetical protein